MTAKGRRLAGRRTEQRRKKTHGHGQQWGDCGGREIDIRELNGNGRNAIFF